MRKNFSKSVKLFDIAGQDGLRPAMQCVQFKDGFAYATDGHMLIKATLQDITNFDPEELAILEGKCISADSLKRICQHDVVEVTRDGIVAEDKTLGCKVTYTWAKDEIAENFPNCEKVLHDALVTPLQKKDTIGVSYNLLETLTGIQFCAPLLEFLGKRKDNEVNTLHWHDAKKQLPYNDKSSKIIAYKNTDEDTLQWMGAYFNGKDWVKETKIVLQGIRIELEVIVPDVRYWSDMPTINFEK